MFLRDRSHRAHVSNRNACPQSSVAPTYLGTCLNSSWIQFDEKSVSEKRSVGFVEGASVPFYKKPGFGESAPGKKTTAERSPAREIETDFEMK
jgi:hypothetical protein